MDSQDTKELYSDSITCNNEPQICDVIPYSHFSSFQKSMIVVIVSIISILGPIAIDIVLPTIQETRDSLNVTDTEVTWTMTSYTISISIFPLLWNNISDHIGRKSTYIISLLIFICGSIGCALSRSLSTLIISRIVQSIGAAPGLSLGAGSISDIYAREQRGRALSINYTGVVLGPTLGPILGGYIGNWRWVFWSLAIAGSVLLLASVFVLPETHRRIVSQTHEIQDTEIPLKPTLKDNNPVNDLANLRYPAILAVVVYSAIAFGAYFANLTTLQFALREDYALSGARTGIAYLPIGVGCIVGSLAGGKSVDYSLKRSVQGLAESRLRVNLVGSIVLLGAVLASGWLIETRAAVSGVLSVGFFIGFGLSFTTQCVTAYLIDVYPKMSARITGVHDFVRTCFAGGFAQVFPIMLERIGRGWSHTVVFFMLLIGTALVTLVAYKGEMLRRKFGPNVLE